jgi:hypothetical protein
MSSEPGALLTLDQAARLIPGADADTLKRLARRGKLSVTRPGKAYLTTAADVQEAIRLCRVTPKARDCGFVPRAPTALPPLGSSLMDLGNAALDSALAQAKVKKTKR